MPRIMQTVRPVVCDCPLCRPDRSGRRVALVASIITFGGTLAMAIDLSGHTPPLAHLLGMM